MALRLLFPELGPPVSRLAMLLPDRNLKKLLQVHILAGTLPSNCPVL